MVLFATCAVVLVIGGVGIWVRGLHRTSAAPLPWTNVTFSRFATHGGIPFRVAISPDGGALIYKDSLQGLLATAAG